MLESPAAKGNNSYNTRQVSNVEKSEHEHTVGNHGIRIVIRFEHSFLLFYERINMAVLIGVFNHFLDYSGILDVSKSFFDIRINKLSLKLCQAQD